MGGWDQCELTAFLLRAVPYKSKHEGRSQFQLRFFLVTLQAISQAYYQLSSKEYMVCDGRIADAR